MSKMTSNIILLITMFIVVWILYKIIYPSYMEGQFRPKLNDTISTIYKYALENDVRDSDFIFPISIEDPVSEQPYIYGSKGSEWYIISVGPDKILNFDLNTTSGISNHLPYDPTNGYFSSGDIVYTNEYFSGIRRHPADRKGRWVPSYQGYKKEH